MPAFNTSAAYREAAGFPREYGAWNWQQFQDWLDNAARSGNISNALRDQVISYASSRFDSGYSSPGDIRSRGEDIMPVNDILAVRRGNLDRIGEMNAGRTTAGQTMDSVYGQLGGMADDISRTGELTQREIDDLYGRNSGRREQTDREYVDNLSDTYGSARAGVNDTFGSLRGRNEGLTGDIQNSISANFGGLRRNNANVTRGLLDDSLSAFDDVAGRTGSTYSGLRGDLDRTVGGLEGGARDVYGNLISRQGSEYDRLSGTREGTFGDLSRSGDETYDSAIASAEGLLPTGDALAARMARQFAPVVANVKQRLRTAGVGPNDLQSVSALSDVEARRAEAMDDAQATGMGEAVDRLNRLREGRHADRVRLGLGNLDRNIDLTESQLNRNERLQETLRDTMERLGMRRFSESRDLNLGELSDVERQTLNRELQRQGLSLGELEREISLGVGQSDRGVRAAEAGFNRESDLAQGQSDRVTGLGLQQGQDFRNNLIRSSLLGREDEMNRTAGTINNMDVGFNRTQDWRDRNINAAQLQRAMEMGDFQTASNLLREMNQEEMAGLDLRNTQYDRGEDWIGRNDAIRDSSMGNLANIYAREQGRQLDAAGMANRFGNTASQAYGQTAQQEAGRGNWGWRLIGGLGAAGLNYLLPGSGDMLNGIMGSSGLYGPQGQQGGRGGPGGGQGGYGGGNQFSFNWLQPYLNRTPTPSVRTPPFVAASQQPMFDAATAQGVAQFGPGVRTPNGYWNRAAQGGW